MRFGIYSLAGLVRNELSFDPASGDVFVFLGKRLNQIHLLQWDEGGFALYVKKLEQGTFEWHKGENIHHQPAIDTFYKVYCWIQSASKNDISIKQLSIS
ncbi:IS66 family insertion sequence element accessory protein TnpB [Dyadobacter chenwenxiniae]|uniref:IS66 family insertion sequence element accessory protein TnpB n=2 Tax=Dyadobacter chenwenxiniae TaxID=2906456 RepID=A0A9X1PLK2_9BACT|nr:IS66 family insertion sequence element accessory protein TnpB [Dyadobacter chenwenxiniae]UON81575.1 IS66 family insertion sequence element accessory protein TnpB [Dyadobacter chenwenxiniae]